MANGKFKYMDVDIIAFLEEKMKDHVMHYQADFEVDKNIIRKAARSERKEDKTLLWMGRTMGTHCMKEHDVFIRDSAAHNTWRFYAEQTSEPVIAYAAEITGIANGVIQGNVYELDYRSHVNEVVKNAVDPMDVEKTFEDGYVDRVAYDSSWYGHYAGLVDEHGSVVDSLMHPLDKAQHAFILSQQKKNRRDMKPAELTATKLKPSLNQQIQSAASKSGRSGTDEHTPIHKTEHNRR